jgi:hypothetical protein
MNSFTKDQVWIMREAVRVGRADFVHVPEVYGASSFEVYPNPSSGSFIIAHQHTKNKFNIILTLNLTLRFIL